MKMLYIIKTGTTFPAILKQYGDFEEFIIRQADLDHQQAVVIDVTKNMPLPKTRQLGGVIITGSHSMVTDREVWSVTLGQWLRTLKDPGIPVLGICYGHQLLGQAFGGEVGYHPDGAEMGTVGISLTEKGWSDPLLNCLPAEFCGHVAHSQTVLKLPPNAVLLARNEYEHHQAFSLYGHIWGVQFHPEFNAGITHAYIEAQRDMLLQKGYDIKQLHDTVREHEYGKQLLKRFVEIVESSR